MLVLDASVVVPLVLDLPPHSAAVHAALESEDGRMVAPHLLDLEVAQVLRRYVRRGEVSRHAGDRALRDLGAMRLRRYPHGILLPRVWSLRDNLTAYDAAYVALAELLEAVLLTRDARLASAPGLDAGVRVVA